MWTSTKNRFNDSDICGILLCIDDVNRLKTVKLDGCVIITGSGLKPLMSSTMLEQIDLDGSATKVTNSLFFKLSVIPILTSINVTSLADPQGTYSCQKRFVSDQAPLGYIFV